MDPREKAVTEKILQQIAGERQRISHGPAARAAGNMCAIADVTWIRFLCLLRSAMILQLSLSVREAAQAHSM